MRIARPKIELAGAPLNQVLIGPLPGRVPEREASVTTMPRTERGVIVSLPSMLPQWEL